MRILIVSEDIPYPNMGGLAKHALNLARALIRAGHEVDLLGGDQHPIEVCGEEGHFGGRFFGELTGHHAGWKESKLGMYMPPKRIWVARKFATIILRHAPDYDVIHYHGHIPNVARYIPKDVNFVQTRHDHGSECLRDTRFRCGAICETADPVDCASCITAQPNAIQRAISKTAVIQFRREVADAFHRHKTIFVSDMLQQNFARTLGPGPWGVTVHNFVDGSNLKKVRESVEPTPSRDQFHVFIASKIYPAKGVESFLRELLSRLPPHIQVTLAGDGGDAARLSAEFKNHSQIHFLGWRSSEETLRRAASSHAIVVPSVWLEPCATTVLEGLLLGKPTFALARGGTPELAVYGAPGQLRLHADMRSLVDDLTSFDPQTSYATSANGLGSVDHAVEKLLSIYVAPPGPLFQLTG
jgi:glycosyltransferase involved in cell wall biosynthesis